MIQCIFMTLHYSINDFRHEGSNIGKVRNNEMTFGIMEPLLIEKEILHAYIVNTGLHIFS